MPIDFDAKLWGMSVLEIFAAVLGLVSVALTVKQNIWCFPIGIVMVSLYIKIFADARLYADAGLQVIYVVLQVYGWYEWLHGGPVHDPLPVSVASPRLLLGLAGLGVLGTAVLGYTLASLTDQAFPYADSGVAVFSLIAQWMLARKLIQNWLVWIAVDAVAIKIYALKQLYATAVLYGVFLVMAAAGFIAWRMSLAAETKRASGVPEQP